MKTPVIIALSVLAGAVLGGVAVQSLHAQARAPAYVIGEIDVTAVEAFDKEYVPPASKAVIDGGGKYVVRGGKTVALYGAPPKPRLAIMVFDSMEKAQAAFDSAAYKDAKKLGDKYATFRIYAVEGLPQ